MRAFVVVAQKGSFKLAAQELARTQPAISLAIQQLENSIGMKLLERTTRKVSLTIEGENFIPVAERLIRDFDAAISDLNATADRRTGHVSIATIPSIATTLLPGVVKKFTDKYPGISVHIIDDNSKGVQRRLERNEVDLGIAGDLRKRHGLLYRPLVDDRMEMVCHIDHPLSKMSSPLTWKVLQDFKFLDSGYRDILSIQSLIDDPRYEFTTTTTLFAMVKANIGYTVLPGLAAHIKDPNIISRPLIRPIVNRKVNLITRKDWSFSPAGEAMAQILVDTIPDIIKSLQLDDLRSKIDLNDFPELSVSPSA
ncbi:MAG: LysR family transcriptional regulator [Acidimicrobiales bacterium]|nr:LysR family transcriptional regulator [Hyphomonadaceae bacterium]RZV44642.1 MAG: LysR family transcriptional regulator [Acidimicrobiales bacterium]